MGAGFVAYLVPLFVIGLRLLFGSDEKAAKGLKLLPIDDRHCHRQRSRPAAPHALGGRRLEPQPAGFDLLRLPMLGRFLRWKHARLCLQLPLLLLAAAIVFDGFFGPQVASMNLAGVLPWIHWRGLVVLGLLASGNVFCMACPFMVPRTMARRLLPARAILAFLAAEQVAGGRSPGMSFYGLMKRLLSGTARG